MKLYYSKGACSLVVRILIHEMGLKSEFESVNLQTKKTETGKDFLTINPKGYVPALVLEDQTILTENLTIQIYLAENHKTTELLPQPDDFNRYRILEWSNYITTEIHKSFGGLFNPFIPDDLKEKIFAPMIKKKFEWIEKQWSQKKFLAGDHFTLPDAYLFVMLLWAHLKKIDIQHLTKLNQYFESLKQRPSIKKSLEEEGLNR